MIESGKTVNIQYKLNDKNGRPVNISSVIDEPMKFLGSEVSGTNTPLAMFALIYSKLETKLENISKSTLRGEHKLNIYSRYALPSMRFYFSVHHMHKTHIEKLDALTRSHLKKWLSIQKHGVTDTAIFHPYMLSIKAPSQVYLEAHAGNYALMRTKGDSLVNHTLDSRLERESEWTNKYSTISAVHKMWQNNIENNNIQAPHEDDTYASKKNKTDIAKKAMKKSIQHETTSIWNTKVLKLTF